MSQFLRHVSPPQEAADADAWQQSTARGMHQAQREVVVSPLPLNFELDPPVNSGPGTRRNGTPHEVVYEHFKSPPPVRPLPPRAEAQSPPMPMHRPVPLDEHHLQLLRGPSMLHPLGQQSEATPVRDSRHSSAGASGSSGSFMPGSSGSFILGSSGSFVPGSSGSFRPELMSLNGSASLDSAGKPLKSQTRVTLQKPEVISRRDDVVRDESRAQYRMPSHSSQAIVMQRLGIHHHQQPGDSKAAVPDFPGIPVRHHSRHRSA